MTLGKPCLAEIRKSPQGNAPTVNVSALPSGIVVAGKMTNDVETKTNVATGMMKNVVETMNAVAEMKITAANEIVLLKLTAAKVPERR